MPCGPINDLADVFKHPQVIAREMCITLPHPEAGEVKLVGNPIKMSATPAQYSAAPPTLGQDTEQILRELLQYPAEKITQLAELGVVSIAVPAKN